MIAVNIGRTFLQAYNEREGAQLSAKEFFEGAFATLFFDHPKYMITGGNSPLENPKIQWKKKKYPTKEERVERISKTIAKIENSKKPDASIAIGFPAAETKEFATTSGQVTNMDFGIGKEDVFLSWIGSGFGVGVAGGMSIFFDHPDLLLALFDGWAQYRSYLNDEVYEMRGNQINTWNGQWLAHRFSKHFRADDPMIGFEEAAITPMTGGGTEVNTQSWVKVLIGIAYALPMGNLTGYVHSLGQTNKTIGFIPFQLPKIRRPIDLYKKLFGEQQYLKDAKQVESLYGTALGFQKACQMGAIGVKALEPKGLRGMVPTAHDSGKMPNYKKAKEEVIVSYRTYQTWLLAMLNNDELWNTAGAAAEAFLTYERGAGKAKKDRSNNVKKVLDASNRKAFISGLTTVMKEADEYSNLVELGKSINSMPPDNFNYFVTLIRFRYAELSKEN